MKFAVIPWTEKLNNNELFSLDSPYYVNGLAEPYVELKKHVEEKGHEINTIDCYSDLKQVDFILFFDWFPEWIVRLSDLGLADRMVYCNAEPPTVRPINSPEGYERVKKFFPYIMTWNKALVDDKRFFFRTIPYNFAEHVNDIPFEEKKLLTSISANKKSDYVDELYTEREELITFFENRIPDQFDMYGVGWDKNTHKSYGGSPESKFDTYARYKFALALENTRNVRGYVTEKIFDCLTAGIVPVYHGADDICDYVSKDCFIDYRDFNGPEELLQFLDEMPRDKYNKYLDSARELVKSKSLRYQFSGSMYGDNILEMAKKASLQGFKISFADFFPMKTKQTLVRIKKGLVHLIKKG